MSNLEKFQAQLDSYIQNNPPKFGYTRPLTGDTRFTTPKEERLTFATEEKKAVLAQKQQAMPWNTVPTSSTGINIWNQPNVYNNTPRAPQDALREQLKQSLYAGQAGVDDPLIQVQRVAPGTPDENNLYPYANYRSIDGTNLNDQVSSPTRQGSFKEDAHRRQEKINASKSALTGQSYIPKEYQKKDDPNDRYTKYEHLDFPGDKKYATSRKKMWKNIYPEGAKTLYSGEKAQRFSSGDRGGDNLQTEHVYPMSWVRAKMNEDEGTNKDRKEWNRTSAKFNEIEADMHNLFPARAGNNKIRNSMLQGYVEGDNYFDDAKTIKIDTRNQIIEPQEEARGRVARATMYMADKYGLNFPEEQAVQMQKWSAQYPPDQDEQLRNLMIEKMQGNKNPYIADFSNEQQLAAAIVNPDNKLGKHAKKLFNKKERTLEMSGSGIDLEGAENLARAGASGVISLGTGLVKAAAGSAKFLGEAGISKEDKAAFKSMEIKDPREYTPREAKLAEGKDDYYSTYGRLKKSNNVEHFMQDLRDNDEKWAAKADTTELNKVVEEKKAAYGEAADSFNSAKKKWKDGDETAALAEGSIAALKIGGEYLSTIFTDPGVVAQVVAQSAAQMLGSGSKLVTAVPAMISMAANSFDNQIADYKEEYGREPDADEVASMIALSGTVAFSERLGALKIKKSIRPIAQKTVKKATTKAGKAKALLLNKRTKAIGGSGIEEGLTEGYQGFAEQYGGKQDLFKVKGDEVFAEASLGTGAGVGITGAGQALPFTKDTAKAALTGAKIVKDKTGKVITKGKEGVDKVVSPLSTVELDPTKESYDPSSAFHEITKKLNNTKTLKEKKSLLEEMVIHAKALGTQIDELVATEDVEGNVDLAVAKKLETLDKQRVIMREIFRINKAAIKKEEAKLNPESTPQAASKRIQEGKGTPEDTANINEAIGSLTFGSRGFEEFTELLESEQVSADTKQVIRAGLAVNKLINVRANRDGQTPDTVRAEMLAEVTNEDGKKGLDKHINDMNAALEQGDRDAYVNNLKELQAWRHIQSNKIKAIEKGIKDEAKFVTWGTQKSEKKPYSINPNPTGSQHQVDNFYKPELALINAAVELATAQGKVKWGTVPVQEEYSDLNPPPADEYPSVEVETKKKEPSTTKVEEEDTNVIHNMEKQKNLKGLTNKQLGEGIQRKQLLLDGGIGAHGTELSFQAQRNINDELTDYKTELKRRRIESSKKKKDDEFTAGSKLYDSISAQDVEIDPDTVVDLSDPAHPLNINNARPFLFTGKDGELTQYASVMDAYDINKTEDPDINKALMIYLIQQSLGENVKAKKILLDTGSRKFIYTSDDVDNAAARTIAVAHKSAREALRQQAKQGEVSTAHKDDARSIKDILKVEVEKSEEQIQEEKEKLPTKLDTVNTLLSISKELNAVPFSLAKKAAEIRDALIELIEPIKRGYISITDAIDGVEVKKKLDTLYKEADKLLDPYRYVKEDAILDRINAKKHHNTVWARTLVELGKVKFTDQKAKAARQTLISNAIENNNVNALPTKELNAKVLKDVHTLYTKYGFPSVAQNLVHESAHPHTHLHFEEIRNPVSVLGVIPGFMRKIAYAGTQESLVTQLSLTENELEVLKDVAAFTVDFTKMSRAVHDKDSYDAKNNNIMAYLNQKEGNEYKLPENLADIAAVTVFNWLGTRATESLSRDETGVNRLLNRESKTVVSDLEMELLSERGLTLTSTVKNLGGIIRQQAGLTARHDTNGHFQEQLELSLGLQAIQTLHAMGIVKYDAVSNADLQPMRDAGKFISIAERAKRKKEGPPKDRIVFVHIEGEPSKVFPSINVPVKNSITESIVDKFRDEDQKYNNAYKDTFKRLFSMESYVVEPLNDVLKPEDSSDLVKGEMQVMELSDIHKQARDKQQAMKHFPKKGMWNILSSLDYKTVALMAGLKEDLETEVHVTKVASTRAKNSTITRDLDHIYNYMRGRKLDQPYYLNYNTVSSTRSQASQTVADPQKSKNSRFLFGPESYRTVIDITKDDQLNGFKIALMEGFGVGADKVTRSNAVAYFDDQVMDPETKELKGEFKKVVSILNEARDNDEMLSPEDQIYLVDTINSGGEKLHTLDVLSNLVTLHNAIEYHKADPVKTRTTVEVDLFREIDGITDGIVNTAIQLGVNTPQGRAIIRAGGMAFVGDPTNDTGVFTYSEYASQLGVYDNYQTLAKNTQRYLDQVLNGEVKANEDDKRKLAALLRILPPITAQDMQEIEEDLRGITPAGRKLNKYSVMITGYGSGSPRVVQERVDLITEMFYEALMKKKDSPEGVSEILSNLAIITGQEEFGIEHLNDARAFVMNLHQQRSFVNTIEHIYGAALTQALKDQLGDLDDGRNAIINGMRLQNEIFTRIFTNAVTAATERKGGDLNRAELKEILTEIAEVGLMPGYRHAGSSKKHFKDSLQLTKFINELVKGASVSQSYKGQKPPRITQYTIQEEKGFKKVVALKTKPQNSLTASVRTPVPIGDVGPGGMTLGILSFDAVLAATVSAQKDLVNLFDATGSGILEAESIGNLANKTSYDQHTDWSIGEAFKESYARFMDHLHEDGEGYQEKYALGEKDWAAIDASLVAKPIQIKANDVDAKGNRINIKLKSIYTLEESGFNEVLNDELNLMSIGKKVLLNKTEGIAVSDHYSGGEGTPHVVVPTKAEKTIPTQVKDKTKKLLADLYAETYSEEAQGSQEGSIKEDFIEQYSKPITSLTAETLFDDLGKEGNVTEDPKHSEYLREFLTGTLIKGMSYAEDMYLHFGLAENSSAENSGEFIVERGENNIYVASAIGASTAAVDMSLQEVYTHEVTHALWYRLLGLDIKVRNRVRRLFDAAEKVITVEDFLRKDANRDVIVTSSMEEEMVAAQARYDYVFKNTDKNAYLHEFATIGTTNAAFMKALEGVSVEGLQGTGTGTLPSRIWQQLLKLIDLLSNKTKGNPKGEVATALQLLAKDMNNINAKHVSIVDAAFRKTINSLNPPARKLVNAIVTPMQDLGKYVAKHPPKSKILKTLTSPFIIPYALKSGHFKEALDDVMYKFDLNKDNMVHKLIEEISGADTLNEAYHTLHKEAKKIGDIAVAEQVTIITEVIMSAFGGADKMPDRFDMVALNAVLLKTNMASLIDVYQPDELVALQNSKAKLAEEIERLEGLTHDMSENSFYWINQARNLGGIMSHGNVGRKNSNLNAYNIVTLLGTNNPDPTLAVDEHMDIVTKLSTLHAIQNTPMAQRETSARIMKSEFERDPSENGVLSLLYLARDAAQLSLERNFDNNPISTYDGFTHEMFQDNISVKFAPMHMQDALKQEGYYFHSQVSQEKGNNNEVGMFVNGTGVQTRKVSTIFGLRSETSMGTNLRDMARMDPYIEKPGKAAFQERLRMIRDNASEIEAQFAGIVPLDYKNNHMVPIFSPIDGRVTDFRFMMNESTKVNALGKEDQAHIVMGRMYGDIINKEATKTTNAAGILLTKTDWDNNSLKHAREFVMVGPDSPNPAYVKKYNKLPAHTKIVWEQVWGGPNAMVRASMVDTLFGFNKMSLADWIDSTIGLDPHMKHALKLVGMVWQAMISKLKRGIVMFVPDVLLQNTISNYMLLALSGVAPVYAGKKMQEGVTALNIYQKDNKRIEVLRTLIRMNPGHPETNNRKRKVKRLEHDLSMNPIAPLINAGMFQSIIEDVDLNDPALSKTLKQVSQNMKKLSDKTDESAPPWAKKAYKYLNMTPDLEVSALVTSATQFSDFIARYALYSYLTEEKNGGIAHLPEVEQAKARKAALFDIEETFINYETPTSPQMQWLNDNGVLMYTKFGLRILRIILRKVKDAPGTAVLLEGGQQALGDVSDILDQANPLLRVTTPVSLLPQVFPPDGARLVNGAMDIVLG